MKRVITKGEMLCRYTICIVVLLLISLSQNVFAKENDEKIVRVGYDNVRGFEEGLEGEYKTGFGYEYLQKISYNTGWRYEYVYGSFNELLEMVTNGEIDFMGDVTKTPLRIEKMNFSSYPEGSENFYIFAGTDKKDLIGFGDEILSGSKIGVAKNTVQIDLLYEYLEKKGIDAEVIEIESTNEIVEALSKNEVDFAAMSDAADYGYIPIQHIGAQDYYFAVAKGRTDILEELNDALSKIQTTNPDYNINNAMKYSLGVLGMNYLTNGEKTWLVEHENVIRMGYLVDNMPYSGVDSNGEPAGVLKIIIDNLKENFGINVKSKGYGNLSDLQTALYRGEIDCYGPAYADFYVSECNRVIQTNPIMTTTPVLLYKEELSNNIIAVSESSIFCGHATHVLYPDAELVVYDSEKKCLESVLKGETDCTIIASGRLNVLQRYAQMEELEHTEIIKNVDISMFTNLGEMELANILDKVIFLSETQLKGAAFVEGSDGVKSITPTMVIRKYAVYIIAIFALILVILLILLIRTRRAEMLAKKAIKDAEAANNAKTIFLNNMSHDIRTPMNAILGYTKLMSGQFDNPNVLEEYLQRVTESSEYLLSIINDVLDMSYIDSGKLQLEENVINVSIEERYIMDMFSEAAKEKNIKLELETDVKNQYVYADKTRLEQIMVNLLSNAIKYTGENGNISIHVTEIPTDEAENTVLEFTVSDDGIGMSPEFAEHIFEAFSRERNTTESKVFGTGLGMSIVKRLVDLMEGSIELESELGKGTTFKVRTPHRIANASEIEEKEELINIAKTDVLRGKNILLVEDNDLNAEIAMVMLEDEGCHVERAEDGVICLEKVKKSDAGYYDVILMDIQMPNMNGYDATREIRRLSHAEKASIPIVAMTANAFLDDRKQAIDCGMNDFVAKPVNASKLIEAIIKVIK